MADPEPDGPVRRRTALRILRIGVPILVVVLVVILVFTILAARSPGRPQSSGTITEWVAVLDVGPDARSLYPAAADVAEVAGVYVFVDRWACYDGFPAGSRRDRGDWFLGVGAADRSTVDGIVQRLGRTPLAYAQVQQGCPLPMNVPSTDART
jgi:hypothetical protein